jgi:hypothetical protein
MIENAHITPYKSLFLLSNVEEVVGWKNKTSVILLSKGKGNLTNSHTIVHASQKDEEKYRSELCELKRMFDLQEKEQVEVYN